LSSSLAQPVPEPASVVLVLVGLGLTVARRR
ncbi:MAG: PEP-CTERM sorting domain-containing protein, partial [Aeoliella sp.]